MASNCMALSEKGACTLISATCTTGWFDWVHGELWYCPNGLLRRSLGLRATLGHGTQQTVNPMHRPTRTFAAHELHQISSAGRRNRWVPWNEVTHVTLKRGIVDHSLHVELTGGRREKFLWLSLDGGFDLLSMELGLVIPGRFDVVDSPIG
jgi:hypothetical protein